MALLTVLGAFAGALLSLLVSIYIEYQREPKLRLTIENPPFEHSYTNAPAKNGKFLRLHLVNDSVPKWLGWLGRTTAYQCTGRIQFFNINDGTELFSRPMPIRWSYSDEPFSNQLLDGKVVLLFDSAKYNAAFRRDCFPGNPELLDVAAKFDNDEECFGWSNESYIKGWRNPEFKLPRGRYSVRITVQSAGGKTCGCFVLENEGTKAEFKLSEDRQSSAEGKVMNEGSEKPRDWFDWLKAGLEILGLAVLIAYTTFAALQWHQMKRATNLAQKANNDAWKLADRANQTAVDSERPWVGTSILIQNWTDDKARTAVVLFTNSGRRPAKATLVQLGKSTLNVFPSRPRYETFKTDVHSIALILPNSYVSNAVPLPELTQDRLKELGARRETFFIYSNIEYEDVFTHAKHWTHACWEYFPGFENGAHGFVNCSTYNEVDGQP